MAEDTLYNAMLLDFYGPLLTEKQREYFDLHYNSDYSLTEIAQESGVSRQAVWDNITRARRTMEDMERKTGLIRRFEDQESIRHQLEEDLKRLEVLCDEPARKILREMEEKLQKLKGFSFIHAPESAPAPQRWSDCGSAHGCLQRGIV